MHKDNHSHRAAALPRRLAAMLYDGLAVIALMFAAGAVAISLNRGEAVEGLAANLLGLALLVIWLGYLALSWRRGGQTLGMRAWRLHLVNDRRGPVSMWQVVMRGFGGAAGLALAGAGYVWGLFRHDRRAWPDLLSRTRIVLR